MLLKYFHVIGLPAPNKSLIFLSEEILPVPAGQRAEKMYGLKVCTEISKISKKLDGQLPLCPWAPMALV